MTVRQYHRELTRRLKAMLDERLIGVYVTGSFGLGDFDASRSELDVSAVCSGQVPSPERQAIARTLRHEHLPCPARGLEFVLYPESTARIPTADAGFLVNLNTGPGIGYRFDEAPGTVERFWFPIDRALVRTAGVALWGPPAAEVFAPIPRDLLIPVVRESLEWHSVPRHCGDDDAVLNACRTLRWLREDVWSSKSAAGAWSLEHLEDRALVAAALKSRNRRARLGRDPVQRFLHRALDEVTRAQLSAGSRGSIRLAWRRC